MMGIATRRIVGVVALIQFLVSIQLVGGQAPDVAPSTSLAPTVSFAPSVITASPTLEPIVSFPPCFDNTTVLFQAMLRANSFIQSTYIMCPNSRILIGTDDENNECCIDGDFSIFPRARSTVMCGADGKPSNNCTLVGGNVQVFFVGGFYGDAISSDITIMGMTFEDSDFVSLAAAGRGDLTFVDCIWRVGSTRCVRTKSNFAILVQRFSSTCDCVLSAHLCFATPQNHFRSSGTVFIAYSASDDPGAAGDGRRSLADAELLKIEDPMDRARYAMSREYIQAKMREETELGQLALTNGSKSTGLEDDEDRQLQAAFLMEVDFVDSLFQENRQGPTDIAGIPLFGVISILTPFNPTKVHNCNFVDNEYDGSDGSQNGFAIQSLGSPLEVTECCFTRNSFIGFAPVQAFAGAAFSFDNNFATEDDLIFCQFGAIADSFSPDGAGDVTCIFHDLETCRGDEIIFPAPTGVPDSSADSWYRRTALSSSWLIVSGLTLLWLQIANVM